MAKYVLEGEPLSCSALAEAMGLPGEITRLTIYPEGAVEVETRRPLTGPEESGLRAILTRFNLPRGRKPERAV